MSLSLVHSRALLGLEARPVCVEVHLANGLPSFTLVGLADVEVKEARERVRSALQNAGLEFPHNKRITVNLAPADLPKDSGRFDLPIALGILAASGQIDASRLAGWEFAGELSLSGELRPVRGALAMSLALHEGAIAIQLVLPPGSAEEAALVPGAKVWRARHLLDVVRQFLPSAAEPGEPVPGAEIYIELEPDDEPILNSTDFSETEEGVLVGEVPTTLVPKLSRRDATLKITIKDIHRDGDLSERQGATTNCTLQFDLGRKSYKKIFEVGGIPESVVINQKIDGAVKARDKKPKVRFQIICAAPVSFGSKTGKNPL